MASKSINTELYDTVRQYLNDRGIEGLRELLGIKRMGRPPLSEEEKEIRKQIKEEIKGDMKRGRKPKIYTIEEIEAKRINNNIKSQNYFNKLKQENPDKLNEYHCNYYNKHKEAIKEKSRRNNMINKMKIDEATKILETVVNE